MNKVIYNQVAKQINQMLPYGSVMVISTNMVNPQYCDKWSIVLDDDAYAMLYEQQDKKTANVFFDQTFSIGDGQYYIEPYNHQLMNLAIV